MLPRRRDDVPRLAAEDRLIVRLRPAGGKVSECRRIGDARQQRRAPRQKAAASRRRVERGRVIVAVGEIVLRAQAPL